ncbi:hypothetical protein BSNT_09144 [Bacillus subtilis subsp. natto BEST195]|nr:hypothetical protein BSNT_09144 [Bacillus subtilis subsp. natto BEST195]
MKGDAQDESDDDFSFGNGSRSSRVPNGDSI